MNPDELDDLDDAFAIDPHDASHEEMVHAIGCLALTSAEAEASLRAAIGVSYLFDDDAWIVLEGESVAWLIDKMKLACEHRFQGDERILYACSRLKALFEERNRFVHSEMCYSTRGRYVTRSSRRNKPVRVKACTPAEVLGLGDDIRLAARSLVQAVHSAR